MRKYLLLLLSLGMGAANAQTSPNKAHENAIKEINQKRKAIRCFGQTNLESSQVGYQESKKLSAFAGTAQKEGFKVQAGVAEIPTAFTATFGEGKPVIGIFGEFDALPGLSQDSIPVKKAIGGIAGHADIIALAWVRWRRPLQSKIG